MSDNSGGWVMCQTCHANLLFEKHAATCMMGKEMSESRVFRVCPTAGKPCDCPENTCRLVPGEIKAITSAVRSESKTPILGEQCEHGALKRQCRICELEAELSAALQRANEAEKSYLKLGTENKYEGRPVHEWWKRAVTAEAALSVRLQYAEFILFGYVYTVNAEYEYFSKNLPPEDACDDGSLVAVYRRNIIDTPIAQLGDTEPVSAELYAKGTSEGWTRYQWLAAIDAERKKK